VIFHGNLHKTVINFLKFWALTYIYFI